MTALRIRSVLAILILLGATHAHSGSEPPSLPGLQPDHQPDTGTPAIDRRIFFEPPLRSRVRLSPDGSRLSFVAPLDGVPNIWVAPADRPSDATPVTRDRGRGIRTYSWAFTGHHLLYLKDSLGDENWRLHSADLRTGTTQELTPFEGVQARLVALAPDRPGTVVVGINSRDPAVHDLYTIDVHTGARRLLQTCPQGAIRLLVDHTLTPRLGVRLDPRGATELIEPASDGSWDVTLRIPPEDTITTTTLGFDRSGSLLYMTDSRGRDTAALVQIDMSTGERRVLASSTQSDIAEVSFNPVTRTPDAVAFNHSRLRWHALDPMMGEDLARLRECEDGDLRIVDRSLGDTRWVVAFLDDDGPLRYYLYTRIPEPVITPLFSHRPELEGLPLAPMHPEVIRSRDGLDLVCYLTLPHGSVPPGSARPREPLPTVLVVHGGPWSRDTWGFDATQQFLASRGYAVLSVNFRGSTGFGKAFTNAGDLQWGARMQDDLIDALQWAVREGVTDESRVAIMGGSFGGYAALHAAASEPDRFAAAVSLFGPADLVGLLESVPPYWAPTRALWYSRVGDPTTEAGRALLRSRSPLHRLNDVRSPLLLVHGSQDPRVPSTDMLRVADGLSARRVPVVRVLFPDEGHGFARPANLIACMALVEHFLAERLGGKAQPTGDAIEASSAKVFGPTSPPRAPAPPAHRGGATPPR